jgi:glycosyltransferase involved in cell wall biosynthesis
MAVHRCQKIIAVSEFSRQEIIRFTCASSDKVTVIPEAADQMYAERLSEVEIRKRLAPLIPPDRPYLLCVANTYPHKNVHTLIQAFGDILDRIPHDLILVGKPRLGEPLVQKAIEQLPQKGRFHRIDRVENDQLIALYQGAELFVFPSLYEGFGLPVLEAMMAGTPVVASQNGSIPEVGGECITYFDEKRRDDLPSKIQDLLHLSKNGRDHLIQKAYLHATSFSWKLTVQKTLACFQSLI